MLHNRPFFNSALGVLASWTAGVMEEITASVIWCTEKVRNKEVGWVQLGKLRVVD
jgi:hypothetical protein